MRTPSRSPKRTPATTTCERFTESAVAVLVATAMLHTGPCVLSPEITELAMVFVHHEAETLKHSAMACQYGLTAMVRWFI